MILVVDDHKDTCDLVRRLLVSAGLLAECVTSPTKAWELVRKIKPQVLLLDVMMPEMSGIEFLRLVRTNPATVDVPVLMMTATTDEVDLAEARRLGAKEILKKGAIDWKNLPERVRSYLA